MLFFFRRNMDKTRKNKEKYMLRIGGKVWVDEHTPFEKRVCGSGLTFSGRYKNNPDK